MNDIAALFEKDPLELTKDDIDKIIAAERAAREAFLAGEKPKAAKKATSGPINLDDLGL
jgi:hypothetical protein